MASKHVASRYEIGDVSMKLILLANMYSDGGASHYLRSGPLWPLALLCLGFSAIVFTPSCLEGAAASSCFFVLLSSLHA